MGFVIGGSTDAHEGDTPAADRAYDDAHPDEEYCNAGPEPEPPLTTEGLIDAVHRLMVKHRAFSVYVSEDHHINRSDEWTTWSGQIWFDYASQDAVSVTSERSPERVLEKLLAGLELRKGDLLHRRDVMPDEIDEDPVQEVHI